MHHNCDTQYSTKLDIHRPLENRGETRYPAGVNAYLTSCTRQEFLRHVEYLNTKAADYLQSTLEQEQKNTYTSSSTPTCKRQGRNLTQCHDKSPSTVST